MQTQTLRAEDLLAARRATGGAYRKNALAKRAALSAAAGDVPACLPMAVIIRSTPCWRSASNRLGTDFHLFSSYADAKAGARHL